MEEEVKILMLRRKKSMKDVSESMGKSLQNLSQIIKRDDLRESELRGIAHACDCYLKISFVDKETGEVIQSSKN